MKTVQCLKLIVIVLLVWSIPTTLFYPVPVVAHIHEIDTIIEFENVEAYPIIIYVFEEQDPKVAEYSYQDAVLQAVSYQDTIQLPLAFTDYTKVMAFSDLNENQILDKNEAGVPLEPVAITYQAVPGHDQKRQTLIRMQFETF